MAMYVGHPISRGTENGYALKGKQAIARSKPINMPDHREQRGTYLAKPVQVQAESPPGPKPPPPPSMPPPPPLSASLSKEIQRPVSPAILKYGMPGQVSDRDKLLSEICGGVHLRPTVTVDKSAPVGAGKVRGGGYSPPPDTTATTSSVRPAQAEPVSFRLGRSPVPEALPMAPPPPFAPPAAIKLKLGGSEPVDREKLLSEVRGGVKLRKVVTNDRSAPIGVGTVRTDLSPAREITTQPPPPPPPSINLPAPPPVPELSPSVSMESLKKTKPITNPALLKLGGKQPVDRDALLASIRGGVKLRKVETADKSAPVTAGKPLDAEESYVRAEPVAVAPPPPPTAPPPPIITLDELHAKKSAKPVNKPALLKLGGKPTVSRDELMQSIRAGVKLRKTITNDKSSAILNDDDSGVKSPGRLSPTTSNELDDVYDSTSDLSSLGTSNLSSLSNIPERPTDIYDISPSSQQRLSETTTAPAYLSPSSAANQDKRSSSRSSPHYERPTMIDIEITRDDNRESEPAKPKADERYTSPIPTREMIEAEIPHGSASERIKMFSGNGQVPSPSLARKVKDGLESTVKESGTWKPSVTRKDNENSIKKMVRKFSQEDDVSQTSQPIWMQVRAQQAEEAKAKAGKDKSEVKSQAKKSEQPAAKKTTTQKVQKSAIDEIKERRASLMNRGKENEKKPAEVEVEEEVEEEAEEVPQSLLTKGRARKVSDSSVNDPTLPPVDNVSKVREKFNKKVEEQKVASEEVPKPGRVRKPSWIKDSDAEVAKSAEAGAVSKNAAQSNLPVDAPTRKKSVRRKKSDTKEGVPKKVGAKKKPVTSAEVSETPPPIPKSLPPKSTTSRLDNEDTSAPREGAGPYRYVRKSSNTAAAAAPQLSSTAANTKNLLNSTPKPYGNHLSTTGHTITIGPSSSDEQPEKSTGDRQLTFKPKSTLPKERDTAFSDTTVTRKAKPRTEFNANVCDVHTASSAKIYEVPINAPWYQPGMQYNRSERIYANVKHDDEPKCVFVVPGCVDNYNEASLGRQGIGRAHRVIIGDSSARYDIRQRFEDESAESFRVNYKFHIDLDNDHEPLRIVQR